MEKFGIFELLDTLSAILGDENGAPREDGEITAPDVEDAAFLPPAYEGEGGNGAISSFLARHDEAVRRLGKKK